MKLNSCLPVVFLVGVLREIKKVNPCLQSVNPVSTDSTSTTETTSSAAPIRCSLSVDQTISDELNSVDGIDCDGSTCLIDQGVTFCPTAGSCPVPNAAEIFSPTFKKVGGSDIISGLDTTPTEFTCLSTGTVEGFNLDTGGLMVFGARGITAITCSTTTVGQCTLAVDQTLSTELDAIDGIACNGTVCLVDVGIKFCPTGAACTGAGETANVVDVSSTTFKDTGGVATAQDLGTERTEFTCLDNLQLEGFNLFIGQRRVSARCVTALQCSTNNPVKCTITVDQAISDEIAGQLGAAVMCTPTQCMIPLGSKFRIGALGCIPPSSIEVFSMSFDPNSMVTSPANIVTNQAAGFPEFFCNDDGQIDGINLQNTVSSGTSTSARMVSQIECSLDPAPILGCTLTVDGLLETAVDNQIAGTCTSGVCVLEFGDFFILNTGDGCTDDAVTVAADSFDTAVDAITDIGDRPPAFHCTESGEVVVYNLRPPGMDDRDLDRYLSGRGVTMVTCTP